MKSRHKGKLETEAYLRNIGIPFTSIRPTYIYGPLNYNPLGNRRELLLLINPQIILYCFCRGILLRTFKRRKKSLHPRARTGSPAVYFHMPSRKYNPLGVDLQHITGLGHVADLATAMAQIIGRDQAKGQVHS